MERIYLKLFIVCIYLFFAKESVSQCSNFLGQWPTTTQTTTSTSLVSISTCVFGGDFSACDVVSGTTYIWTTCSSNGFDTQLTLWNSLHTVSYAYNDDDCGVQSTITWMATYTGVVHVLISEFNCASNTTCQGLEWSASGSPAPPVSNITSCSGSFTDSGGPSANYSDNENEVYVICPSTPGMAIQLNFSQFELEDDGFGGCYDNLEVYNGNTIISPSLGLYCGSTLAQAPGGGIITSTAANGCLTFEFTSDGSVSEAGWNAAISCVVPGSCSGVTPSCAVFPDDCANACSLGTLSIPTACPNSTSVTNSYCLSNIGASAESPYTSLVNCSPGFSMASPSADVWYSFVATTNIIDLEIIGLNTPSIGFYEGTNCNNIIGRGCDVGVPGSGSLLTTFNPLTIGNTYYVQISGEDTFDMGDFQLNIYSYNLCDPCILDADLTVTPAPVNGTYQAGQVVQFCYDIDEWSSTAVNWLHGVELDFGLGWDISSLVITPAVDCSGSGGNWAWYNSVTSCANGSSFGPGFFYDSDFGDAGTGICNPGFGNPGNSYGDNCTGSSSNWSFCWTLTVADCPSNINGSDLNISINTLGDSESGNWSSIACVSDPPYSFFASAICCIAPTLNLIEDLVCHDDCIGQLSVQGNGSAPYDYKWIDSSGVVLRTISNSIGLDTISNLCYGKYFVEVMDNNNCITIDSIQLINPSIIYTQLDTTICSNDFIVINGNSYDISNPSGSEILVASNLCDSIVDINVTIVTVDSTFATATSCFPVDTGYATSFHTNLNLCDSTHTIYTALLASDSTFATAASCFPLDTGFATTNHTNLNLCDSTHTIYTALLASDSTFATASSCLPVDTGYATTMHSNLNLCDSTHTIYTSLLASDSTFATAASCFPVDTGFATTNHTNLNLCDSTHTIYTSLLASDSTFATATSCFPVDTGFATTAHFNLNTCDSTHTIYTSLLASDSTFATATSCFPIDT